MLLPPVQERSSGEGKQDLEVPCDWGLPSSTECLPKVRLKGLELLETLGSARCPEGTLKMPRPTLELHQEP